MVLLGFVVRNGSTRVDDWFHSFGHGPARYLLFFTDPRVLVLIVLATLALTNHRHQWRLAIAIAVCPLLAIALPHVLKPLFGRETVPGTFAYPSGHTTTVVVVMGMVVLVAGTAVWAVILAIAWCMLGLLGMAVTFHYFTDTVGAVLLGTSIVCMAALTLRRTPHQT